MTDKSKSRTIRIGVNGETVPVVVRSNYLGGQQILGSGEAEMFRSAVFSPDGRYRYLLTREWAYEIDCPLPVTTFVMLNPSTADELKDDATVRRCCAFARKWGSGSLRIVNLFAARTPDPMTLPLLPDPVGGSNLNRHFWSTAADRALQGGGNIVCAWGNGGALEIDTRYDNADRQDLHFLLWAGKRGLPLDTFGMTLRGHPKHPLRLRADAKLRPYGRAR